MSYILAMPGKYVQGPGAIYKIGKHLSPFGDRALIMGGPTALSVSKGPIIDSLRQEGIEAVTSLFNGECTAGEIDRLVHIADTENANIVIGIGGGKAIDTAKGVAHYKEVPMISVPTIASTDGPASGVIGLYSEDHVPAKAGINLRSNPNVVLVDTEIILNSPIRYTIAGMGDALSTFVEAEACVKSSSMNLHGGFATASAITCAKLCFDIIMEHGLEAKHCATEKVITDSFEKVIEANILLSGTGFENCGLSVAHGLWVSFGNWDEFRQADVYHGEAVALFTLVQLVLENRPKELIRDVVDFCQSVGLPVSLKDIGFDKVPREILLNTAIKPAFVPGGTIYNVPNPISPDMIFDAFLELDKDYLKF